MMELFVSFAVFVMALTLTVATGGLFFSLYILVTKVNSVKIEETAPAKPSTTPVFDQKDSYTPQYSDQTVPLEEFRPNFKHNLKVKIVDEPDQFTPLETNG